MSKITLEKQPCIDRRVVTEKTISFFDIYIKFRRSVSQLCVLVFTSMKRTEIQENKNKSNQRRGNFYGISIEVQEQCLKE